MSQPFVGEIRMFGGNFAPAGWSFCDGTLLPISENDALFALIGTTYGGDGETTFALPDLRGRVPVHQGNGMVLAETGGVESVTLTVAQMAQHSHPFMASTATALSANPAGNVLGNQTLAQMYVEDVPNVNLNPGAAPPAGGSQPHSNLQPYLCVSFIISLFGIYPNPS